MGSEDSGLQLSRRRFLAVGASALTLAALTPSAALAEMTRPTPNGRLVPAGKAGTILYTQRDVPSRRGIWSNDSPTMGYLGGPNFPDDPTDLGPLVPLPGGFLELFEFLAASGYSQVEFAGYSQNANNRGGANPGPNSPAAYLDYGRTLRGFLDATGLQAIGNHGFIPNTWPGGPGGGMSQSDRDRLALELEFASILGMRFMGTGSDPTNSSQVEAWNVAADKWEALNEFAATWDIALYPHNHADAYSFLQDGPTVEVTEELLTGQPLPGPQTVRGSSGTRRMEHYLRSTDPRMCFIELDVYWAAVAQHRFRWYYDHEGVRREQLFDFASYAATHEKRIPLYHAKDGDRTDQPAGVGNGFNIVPFGTGDLDYREVFGGQAARGYRNPNYEQDNAPGGGADPGKSLRDSRLSARNLLALRG